jgi:hypothetical protein
VGAGPHYHHGRDEFFYLLEGELVLRIGDEHHTAGPGTFAFIPRETIHGFHNASAARARLLVMHHPAGFERFFEEMGQLVARQGSKEERVALAARFTIPRRHCLVRSPRSAMLAARQLICFLTLFATERPPQGNVPPRTSTIARTKPST